MKLSVGSESFEDIRNSGSYYVDKTELICDLVNANNAVTLFTRPRRFGKTLMMRMLESFFDINRDSKAIFDSLDIMRHQDFCEAWMNQYPTIFISLKDVEGLDFHTSFVKLQALLADLCKKYRHLIDGQALDPDDLSYFSILKAEEMNVERIQSALYVLTRIMYTVYGKPVILLIDEYDVPLAKAQENGYYRPMLDVIRGLFSKALKTNEYLKFAVITGCLRISKESIFTGVNNISVYSVLTPRFSTYFGFTEDEVERMLAAAGSSDKIDIIRSWYDGYVFGNSYVYCPWDVVNYVSALMFNSDARPQNYWKNTSGNGILKSFIDQKSNEISGNFETLLNGGTIRQNINDELTYDQLYSSTENLWSVLLMTGYLTKNDPSEQGNNVEMRIPNTEICAIFQDTVVKHFEESLVKVSQEELVEALFDSDEEKASSILSDFLWQTISYNDYHEDYYHAFLAGIFVGLGYAVESDKEHGTGRPDILLTDRRNRRALIIEAKKAESKETMGESCDEAIKQIRQQQYWRGLDDGYRTIVCYGVAFYKKEALLKKM